MTTANISDIPSAKLMPSSHDAMIDVIIGVAIFDLDGLPKEYFVTEANRNTSWVQLVFQALGLKSLLMSSLNLDGFQHITIELNQQTAILVRSKRNYIALLIQPAIRFTNLEEVDRFSQWVRLFESQHLRQHPRFRAA
jgi:predicted regulator of Ras-like GTPase activity (Roadblock/LC7/MglB family)